MNQKENQFLVDTCSNFDLNIVDFLQVLLAFYDFFYILLYNLPKVKF